MRITVTIENPTGDFQNRLLTLLAEHAATVEIDRTWTVPRAEAYYRSLPARARRIVEEAVAHDGYVAAEELRTTPDTSLRGHSGALSRALARGALQGLWPDGMRAPIEPQGPGFGKVVGYRMPDDLVQPFLTAIERTQAGGVLDPHDLNQAVDSTQTLADALRAPIPRRPKRLPTEKTGSRAAAGTGAGSALGQSAEQAAKGAQSLAMTAQEAGARSADRTSEK